MMETREILISNNDGGAAPGILHVRHFDGRERLVRALAVLGACWGVGLATVIVPLVHFVVPPLMLVLGPVMAWRRYRVAAQNERVTGSCPSCGQEITLELDASDVLPLWTYCPPSDDPIQLLPASKAIST
jgi:hypothetical protein